MGCHRHSAPRSPASSFLQLPGLAPAIVRLESIRPDGEVWQTTGRPHYRRPVFSEPGRQTRRRRILHQNGRVPLVAALQSVVQRVGEHVWPGSSHGLLLDRGATHREAQRFAAIVIGLCYLTGQSADTTNIGCALGHGNGTAGIQHVEIV